jgi:uncharacterized protein YdhG (YjbR/CyaY superfamily)
MDEKAKQYIDAIPQEKKALYQQLERVILELYPDVEIKFSYQIPLYKLGKRWVGLGIWKRGVSLYTDGPHHIAEFKRRNASIKTGKGSINFSLTDDIPIEDVRLVIRSAIEDNQR